MGTLTNNSLFSDTYLEQLQNDSIQDGALSEVTQALRDWIGFRDLSSVESMVTSWIEPLLNALELKPVPDADDGHTYPLSPLWGDEQAVGLCYVVPAGQDLNDTTKGRHPMARAVLALRARDLRWGVLTNGTNWRLVHAQSLRRYDHYIEFNLDELAPSSDLASMRVFYACFHRRAFGADGKEQASLERLFQASEEATRAAEQHLKARISHNVGIMARLCQGFASTQRKSQYTEEDRDTIYRDATYLLYRLLFVLYAEARGLLPMEDPAYRKASLAELIETAYRYRTSGTPNPRATTLWDGLRQLCAAIYESEASLGIPAYNGGLFDDADKPTLRDGYIADAYLMDALFDLAYQPDPHAEGGYRPIDYRDLSVRHLGSIYEAMIEYKLFVAEKNRCWRARTTRGTFVTSH